MLAPLILHSYLRCPFAMRVRFALHEKNLPFTVIEEDLKNFSSELKKLHPEGKVPLLKHGDQVIYESSIITEYLEDAFPTTHPLMPKDAALRAEIRLWTYWCNQMFKVDLDKFKYGKSRFKEEDCVGAEEKVKKHLAKLEVALHQNEWLVGQSFSLGDIHVFPFVRQLLRIQPAPTFVKDYPQVLNWVTRTQSRPAFLRTMGKG